MNFLIGLDIGTSSVKGVLMSVDGQVVKTVTGDFCYTEKENGGIEISADDFVNICINTISKLAEGKNEHICGICASSASGNLLVLDRDNKPVTPIYSWQDTHVTTEAEEVLEGVSPEWIYDKVGWPFSYTTFPLAQLCCLKKHSPKFLAECGKVCMSTEYLYFKLTGKWGIGSSAGTPFFLIDQTTKTYIPKLLDRLGICESQLPPIMPCGTVLGNLMDEIATAYHLPNGVPVVLGTFDHPSAARGVGVLEEGQMLLSCGTSWVGFFPVASRDRLLEAKSLIDPFLSDKGGPWATMVSVPSISSRIKRYVDTYIDSGEDAYKLLGKLSMESEKGAGGLTLDITKEPDDALIRSYPKKHIARAIMESTVNLLKMLLDKMAAFGISATSAVMVGGPSSDPAWHYVIKELCGIEVCVIHGRSAGAVGAAKLAGIGVGIYKDEKDAFLSCDKTEA